MERGRSFSMTTEWFLTSLSVYVCCPGKAPWYMITTIAQWLIADTLGIVLGNKINLSHSL